MTLCTTAQMCVKDCICLFNTYMCIQACVCKAAVVGHNDKCNNIFTTTAPVPVDI